MTIRNIRSGIRWGKPKVILNYSKLPNFISSAFNETQNRKMNTSWAIFQDDDMDGAEDDSEVSVDAGSGVSSLLWEDDDMKNFYENLCKFRGLDH